MPGATTSKRAAEGNGATQELETWIEKIVDGKDGSVPRQMFIGGVSGWLTGFLAMKVGKVAATAIGGSIILFQVANHKGYINVNWNRLNRDVEKISKQIQAEAGGKKKDLADKIRNVAKENSYAAVGFVGGFLIGLAS